jgi:2,3-bisphosphoglycerate-dependent phosphoglycerate mutase
MKSRSLVLVRHGESTWNQENRFSGWRDIPLSDRGIAQARNAGQILKDDLIQFDVAFTSLLKRAIKTLWIILEELDQMWIPEYKHWRLNERHYGKLQGLNKAEQAEEYGEEQVHLWRRGWDVRPPLIEDTHDAASPVHQRRYSSMKSEIPRGESLKDTVERVAPYWKSHIRPQLSKGNVLVVAHGNSLRALIKFIENVPEDAIAEVELPTGTPYVLRLDSKLRTIDSGFRGDPRQIESAIQAVKDQGRSKLAG